MPLITEILDALGKERYYTTVDLVNGFHQVPLREEDRPKTQQHARVIEMLHLDCPRNACFNVSTILWEEFIQ